MKWYDYLIIAIVAILFIVIIIYIIKHPECTSSCSNCPIKNSCNKKKKDKDN